MAFWDVADLQKEIADMEIISGRNKGSELLPKMKDALKAKVAGVQLMSPSSFVKLSETLEKSSLPIEIKKRIGTMLGGEDCVFNPGATKVANHTPEYANAFQLPLSI